jgi:hypothetical protein
MIILAFALAFTPIEGSESPKKRFVVVSGSEVEGAEVENWFVDSESKTRFRLKGLDYYAEQNHGGFVASYRSDEKLCLVIHDGKWEPRSIRLVDTFAMKEVDVFSQMKRDGRAIFSKVYKAKYTRAAQRLVFDFLNPEWDKYGRLKIAVQAEIPKENLFGEEHYLWYLWDAKSKNFLLRDSR